MNENILNCQVHHIPLKEKKCQPAHDNFFCCEECNKERNSKELKLEREFQDILKVNYDILVLFPFFYTFISIIFEVFSVNLIFTKILISLILVSFLKHILLKNRQKKLDNSFRQIEAINNTNY